MPFTITQLPSQDKLCKIFTLPILEHFYDRKTVEELITTFHPKPSRARKLTMLVVIYVLICWSLFLGSTLGAVYSELLSTERYLGEEVPEELEGASSLGLSTQTGWSANPSSSVRAFCASLWPHLPHRGPLPMVCD